MNDDKSWEGKEKELREGRALVSVVIPCYNQAHFLSETIESVLCQSYTNFEVVVVDDGSPDNASEVASRYAGAGVRLIRQENQGRAAARNRGLDETQGEYVVFLDSDDRLLPEALQAGVKELEAHPACALVFGRIRAFGPDRSSLGSALPPYMMTDPHLYMITDPYGALLRGNLSFTPGAAMFRRSVFDSVGGFDPSASLRGAEDYHLYLRVASEFPIHHHYELVVEYREHEAGVSRDSARMLQSTLNALHSQQERVGGTKEYEEAYKHGIKSWQSMYGNALFKDVLVHARQREWKQGLRDMLVLIRHDPKVFLRAYLKLRALAHDRSYTSTISPYWRNPWHKDP
jgi:glycosyltransferase involved in cell wall biosynthesis